MTYETDEKLPARKGALSARYRKHQEAQRATTPERVGRSRGRAPFDEVATMLGDTVETTRKHCAMWSGDYLDAIAGERA